MSYIEDRKAALKENLIEGGGRFNRINDSYQESEGAGYLNNTGYQDTDSTDQT